MSEQTNAAAERSAHVERGPRRIPGESFLVEVSPGVFQIKALAEARAEIAQLRAEIVLLEATGAEAADEIERLRAALHLISYAEVEARVAAARREGIEAALAAVDAEPEPEGEMPAKLANTDRRILVLAAVRATKREIDGRIRALLTEGEP